MVVILASRAGIDRMRSVPIGCGKPKNEADGMQVLRTHHFHYSMVLEATLHRYAWLHNEHHPQKSLNHLTPFQTIKERQRSHSHLFQKAAHNHAASRSFTLLGCGG